jgi:DNA-binding response OmpR family regulator
MPASGVYFSAVSREPPRTPRQLRVLIADDERDTVLTLVQLLREEGHEVRGVYNGRDAVTAMSEFDPDAVLLDIAMPDMTGWDVAREIRRRYPGTRPVLIAISGQYKQAADKILGQMAGFDYYLAKPYDPNVLLALLAPLTTRGA